MKVQKRVLFIAPAAIAVTLLAGVGSASAASSTGNCVGQNASFFNTGPGQPPGHGGHLVSFFARTTGGVGQYASTNDCPPSPVTGP
jgi:hypothetical protein